MEAISVRSGGINAGDPSAGPLPGDVCVWECVRMLQITVIRVCKGLGVQGQVLVQV